MSNNDQPQTTAKRTNISRAYPEYRVAVENHSGTLSMKRGAEPFEDGVWIVIEDRQDICSIGMTKAELEAFIVAAREIANG